MVGEKGKKNGVARATPFCKKNRILLKNQSLPMLPDAISRISLVIAC